MIREFREPDPGSLTRALLQAVHARDFAATRDNWHNGAPITHFPSIDLAVAVFTPGQRPRWGNVLFSREQPQGVVANIDGTAGPAKNIRYDRDVQDAKGNSIAWQAGRHWKQIAWQPLAANDRPGTVRFVAPYPASLLKLMVAVGVGMAIDLGLLADWPAALEPMMVVSDNDATTELVALLHSLKLVDELNDTFAELGLATLKLNSTTAAGGWRNGDGSGVGHIHMTAWDTVRLLWLLDADAPPPPWLRPGTTALLQPESRDHLRGVLQRQQLDTVLSSGSLRAVPGWVPGLPDAPAFAHKTGNTDNYASDAGIVKAADDCHYIVALLSSLGKRYAPDERCASTWKLPSLGAAVHGLARGAGQASK